MKILYLDLETTGLTPQHGIHQIAGIVEINGEVKEEFNFFVRPFVDDLIDDNALGVSGITKEQILGYSASEEVYCSVMDIFCRYIDKYDKADKFYPAGYNVKFDATMLDVFFKKNGDKYGCGSFINWRFIDPLPLLHWLEFMGIHSQENYKLETTCQRFGIDLNAHQALSDIRATKKLIDRAKIQFKQYYDKGHA